MPSSDKTQWKRVSDQILRNHQDDEYRKEVASLLKEGGFDHLVELDIERDKK